MTLQLWERNHIFYRVWLHKCYSTHALDIISKCTYYYSSPNSHIHSTRETHFHGAEVWYFRINNQRCAHETIYEGSSPIVRVRVQLRCAFLVFPEVRYGSTEVRRHISVRIKYLQYGSTDGSILFPYFRTVRKYSIRRYRYFRTFVRRYSILSYEGTFVRRYFHRA